MRLVGVAVVGGDGGPLPCLLCARVGKYAAEASHARERLWRYADALQEQQAGQAVGEIAEAVGDQPDAQEAGQEARLVRKNPEGNQPQTPEDLGGKNVWARIRALFSPEPCITTTSDAPFASPRGT